MENVNEEGSEIVYGVFPYAIKKENLTNYPGLYVLLNYTIEEAMSRADRMFKGKRNKLEGIEVMLWNKKESKFELIYKIWKT